MSRYFVKIGLIYFFFIVGGFSCADPQNNPSTNSFHEPSEVKPVNSCVEGNCLDSEETSFAEKAVKSPNPNGSGTLSLCKLACEESGVKCVDAAPSNLEEVMNSDVCLSSVDQIYQGCWKQCSSGHTELKSCACTVSIKNKEFVYDCNNDDSNADCKGHFASGEPISDLAKSYFSCRNSCVKKFSEEHELVESCRNIHGLGCTLSKLNCNRKCQNP